VRSHLRLASVVGAFALSTVAITPALAAAPISQGGANAVYLAVAGNKAVSTGQVTATNDGSGEQKNNVDTLPTIVGALGNNPVLKAGVAGQDATAASNGSSAACAGIAGEDGSLVQVGNGNCLKPGKALTLSLGNIDLSNTQLIKPGTALAPLTDQLTDVLAGLQGGLGQLTAAVEAALAKTPLGEIGIDGNFGALQARCTAAPGTAEGTANLANTAGDDERTPITLRLPGGTSVVLAYIPVNPSPNTKVLTRLDTVTGSINDALKKQFNKALNGGAAPLSQLTDAVQDQLVTNLVAQLQPLLQPLEKQVLDITLNKQSRPTQDSIKVSALDLQLLPAAQAQMGSSLVNLQIGNVACGPNAQRAAAAAPETEAAAPSGLPTAVSAGYATAPGAHAGQGDDSTNAIVLGAFALLMAGAAGFLTFRRLHG
jgi:hypothetical protein